MSKVARTLFGVPASAFVELFFSKTGYIMRPHTRTLGDKIAEDLFFLKKILDLFED